MYLFWRLQKQRLDIPYNLGANQAQYVVTLSKKLETVYT